MLEQSHFIICCVNKILGHNDYDFILATVIYNCTSIECDEYQYHGFNIPNVSSTENTRA